MSQIQRSQRACRFPPAVIAVAVIAAPHSAIAQDLSGFVQVDYRHSQLSSDELADGDGQPLNENRFLIRRARLRADGRQGTIEYTLEADFNTVKGARVGLRETEVAIVGKAPECWNIGFPLTGRVGVGVIRAPLGYEVYVQRDAQRLFAERSLVSQALVPGEFDVGARASLEAPFASLVLAVMNGEPIGSDPFPGRDPNTAKDLLGRLQVRGQAGPVELSGGLAAAWGRGFHPGSLPTKDTLVWRDLNEDGVVQTGELTAIPGGAGAPSQSFDRWGTELDLQLAFPLPRVGTTRIYAEVGLASNLDRGVRPADPVLLGRDQRSFGGYAAIVQEIGDRAAVGVRADYYRPEIDSTDTQGGQVVRSGESFTSVSAAGSWVVSLGETRSRVLLDVTHRRDPLGRDAAGRPDDLANDELTARLEVVF